MIKLLIHISFVQLLSPLPLGPSGVSSGPWMAGAKQSPILLMPHASCLTQSISAISEQVHPFPITNINHTRCPESFLCQVTRCLGYLSIRDVCLLPVSPKSENNASFFNRRSGTVIISCTAWVLQFISVATPQQNKCFLSHKRSATGFTLQLQGFNLLTNFEYAVVVVPCS